MSDNNGPRLKTNIDKDPHLTKVYHSLYTTENKVFE
jgi:hypothetical protein